MSVTVRPRPDLASARGGERFLATSAMEFCGAQHTLLVSELDAADLDVVLERLAVRDDAQGHLLKATLYLRDLELRTRARARLAAMSGRATSVELTVGPPTSGAAAAVFEWRIAGEGVRLVDGDPGRVEQPGVGWQFAAVDQLRDDGEPVAGQFLAAMAAARSGFDAAELASTLIRTWIYVGDINGLTGSIENYQAVNHARRTAFSELGLPYRGSGLELPYPASTGIGTAASHLSLGLLTCRDRGAGVRIVALENPRQTSAFAYPRSASDIPPLFSRAVALCARREAMVLISGTASIVEARSVHFDSVTRQTEQTLANIGELLEPSLLAARGFRVRTGGLRALRGCVVYVKRPDDVPAVRAVCSSHLPRSIPTVFVIADVCRPELLVEIEAIAVVPGDPSP